MKPLKLIIIIIGVSIIFFGCSKDNSLAPNQSQNDEVTSTYKAKKIHTHFTGTCFPTFPPPTNENGDEINEWNDVADDPRVTGVSVWVTDGAEPIDEITLKLWGTAELTVNCGLGIWEMTWRGTMTTTGEGTFRIVAHAVGVGVEGEVEGLTARWKYTMNFDGTPESGIYITKGKITETL